MFAIYFILILLSRIPVTPIPVKNVPQPTQGNLSTAVIGKCVQNRKKHEKKY